MPLWLQRQNGRPGPAEALGSNNVVSSIKGLIAGDHSGAALAAWAKWLPLPRFIRWSMFFLQPKNRGCIRNESEGLTANTEATLHNRHQHHCHPQCHHHNQHHHNHHRFRINIAASVRHMYDRCDSTYMAGQEQFPMRMVVSIVGCTRM